MADKLVTLAAITGAHGVGGEVRLKLFTADAQGIARHRQVRVGDRLLTLLSVKGSGKAPIARFAEVTDRSAADALRGEQVAVPRSALPPLEEGEYYHADLLGIPCVNGGDVAIGIVTAVENFGAGDLLEVEQSEGRRVLVPFKPGIADLRDGRIVLDPQFLA